MQEKTKYKIEFFLTILLIIGILIFKYIPEYKSTLGSSDTFLSTDVDYGIIEIKINDKPDFILVTEEDYIKQILFFDNTSLCLYNQNIEGKTIESGVDSIIEILIKNNYLKSSDIVTLVNYNNEAYQKISTAFRNKLQNMNVDVNYNELQLSLSQRAKSLGIEINDNEKTLRRLELYSKEIIRKDKHTISEYDESTIKDDLTVDNAKELTTNVYRKIEDYARKNNIANQDITSASLPITLIPATKDGSLFPDNMSWYYIKDSQVYAYISITENNKTFAYCYQGSIDVYKKGQC